MKVVFCVVLILNLFAQSTPQIVTPSASEVRYQVSIQRHLIANGLWINDHLCSGVLLSSIWVLTLGTCMDSNGNFKELRVHVGSRLLKGGSRYKIRRVEYHPKYVPQRVVFNFAALQLETTLVYGPDLSYILMPPPTANRNPDCSVSGWKVNKNNTLNNELIRTKVKVVIREVLEEKCRPFFIKGQVIDFNTSHLFCAMYDDNFLFPTEDGNPLVCSYILWGLLIEGGNKDGKGYMMLCRTELIRDWIHDLI